MRAPKTIYFIGIGSLIALIAGFLIGILNRNAEFLDMALFLSSSIVIGKLWIIIVLLLAAPLIIGYILSSMITVLNKKLWGSSVLIHF